MHDPNDTRGNEGHPFEEHRDDEWPSTRRESERGERESWPSERREDVKPVYAQGNAVRPSPTRPRKGSNWLIPLLIGALLCLGLGGLAGWQIGRGSAVQSVPTGRVPGNPGPTYKSGGMTREQVIAQARQSVVQINVQIGRASCRERV